MKEAEEMAITWKFPDSFPSALEMLHKIQHADPVGSKQEKFISGANKDYKHARWLPSAAQKGERAKTNWDLLPPNARELHLVVCCPWGQTDILGFGNSSATPSVAATNWEEQCPKGLQGYGHRVTSLLV